MDVAVKTIPMLQIFLAVGLVAGGFEPPKLECQSVLGMKNGKIPDSAITASSSYSQYHGPERARLDTMRSGSYVGAWIPKSQNGGQWIQVDLPKITKITRLATQGRQDAKQWVKSYSITYSVDGGLFLPYNDNQVLPGNKDSNTIVVHILNPPIIARYIRIHPKEYHGYMALRFELYGCTEEFEPPKLECQSVLGMKNGKIPHGAITASSSYSQYHGPERARLDTVRSGSYVGAWIPKSQNGGQWIQVDLGKITKITRLATQGRQDAKQWVKSYFITYSVGGGIFLPYNDNQVLPGNKDSNTIVGNILDPPIVARYIRIHPKEYQGYMALRFELYGCTDGFEPPKLECKSVLGMKNGKIPDSAITASSSYSQHHGPERARLDKVKSGSYAGAWIPKSQNGGQWIQVDLGEITKITGLATQGRQDAKQWVKSYSISYSVGGGIFVPYNDNQVLLGNTDWNGIVGHILDPPIIARYIRIHPKEYQSYMALRFELYGCTEGFEPPKLECQSDLGMKNGKIPNSAITASSSYSQYHGPERARLDTMRSGSYVGAWIPESQDREDGGQWIQVDLGNITKITRLNTQGRQDASQWVKSYFITYSVGGGIFFPYNDSQVFPGNKDSNTIVGHNLNPPIIARYIRIHPKEYHGYMALRFELYGCTQGFEPPKLECQSDLGMKNGKIPDSAITASSSYSQRYGPERARLGTMQGGSYTEAWVSRYLDEGQWIQVDLGNITKITLVATQGKPKEEQWVKSYSITYSVEGGPFLPYNDNQVLSGNEDSNTIIGHILNPPIIARYIRIHPKDFRYNMALRFELYGCTEGFPIPEVPACQIPLGMQNGKLPNSALSASSQYNAHLKPKNARLHFHREGRRHGAWVAKMQDDNQWFQVDFGVATQITVIATQGRQDADQWVTKYTLRYSTDGSFFEQYQPDGFTKIFEGNTDRYAVVSHNLIPPIRALYIRIVPVEWHSRIALRAEFYGCKTAAWKPIGCYRMTSQALDTYFVRAGNINSISKRYQACVKKADEEGITLFGMDDKRCWTSADAGRSYDKFGPSEHCKEKAGYSSGISERFSLFVYRKNDNDEWKAVGCYLNSGPRALPKPFDKNVRSVSGNDAVFEYCKAKAEEFGYETFGVDDKACWSGDKAEETYDDYGKSERCSVSKKTGNGSGKELNGDMFVYQLSK